MRNQDSLKWTNFPFINSLDPKPEQKISLCGVVTMATKAGEGRAGWGGSGSVCVCVCVCYWKRARFQWNTRALACVHRVLYPTLFSPRVWVAVVDVDLAGSTLKAVTTQAREAVAAVDARALVAARAWVTRVRRGCTCNKFWRSMQAEWSVSKSLEGLQADTNNVTGVYSLLYIFTWASFLKSYYSFP